MPLDYVMTADYFGSGRQDDVKAIEKEEIKCTTNTYNLKIVLITYLVLPSFSHHPLFLLRKKDTFAVVLSYNVKFKM